MSPNHVAETHGRPNAIANHAINAIRNNGGGHYNHTIFWEMMTPGGAKEPGGALAKAIDGAFGSFAAFKEPFYDYNPPWPMMVWSPFMKDAGSVGNGADRSAAWSR